METLVFSLLGVVGYLLIGVLLIVWLNDNKSDDAELGVLVLSWPVLLLITAVFWIPSVLGAAVNRIRGVRGGVDNHKEPW